MNTLPTSSPPAWLPPHVFIIAEAGVNHNGNMNLAEQLIDIAAAAGADAVKFQTFKADRLATPDAPKAEYQKLTSDAGESQYQMLRRLELSAEAHRHLLAHCAANNILFLSTPFEEESADLLEALGVTMFKVPSGEITNLTFLAHLARKGKPLIVSTGMSTLDEVEQAVQTICGAGNPAVALLHCVSNYPADPATTNLRAMDTLAATFHVPVGYSDHTLGNEVAFAAVARGARIIEKHFTLDRTLPGPDHTASSEPAELKSLVQGIRKIESSLGTDIKAPADTEANTAAVARKSLVAAVDIPAGVTLTEHMIAIKRPGTGLPPSMRSQLIRRRVKSHIAAGTLLSLEMLE